MLKTESLNDRTVSPPSWNLTPYHLIQLEAKIRRMCSYLHGVHCEIGGLD